MQNPAEQTIAYNALVIQMTQATITKEGWPEQKLQLKSAIADLKDRAVKACETIDAMKDYP